MSERGRKVCPLYVREFNSDKVLETDTRTYYPSKYFPFPMKDALSRALGNKGYIRPTDFILGPIYTGKDFQVGVTGSIEIDEEPVHAIARELGEEIGIVPKHNNHTFPIKNYSWRRQNKVDVQFHIYEAYIKNCIPVLEHQHQAMLSKNQDRKDAKVGCFVYGDKKSILNFLNSDKIYVYNSNDGIIGIAALRAKDVMNVY
jgi:hypothetical protein